MKSLMLNGIGFVTGEPTLKLDYPFLLHPGMQIRATATASGKSRSVNMMLPLHKGDIIKSINITYKNSGKNSFITQVRLVDQISPTQAFVKHDDGTDLLSTTVATRNSAVANIQVTGSIVLILFLDFNNTTDMIEIGLVEVVYQPAT